MDSKFDTVQRLFREAEDKLKKVERFSKNVLVPSVNELRYAGYHLLKYLQADSDDDLKKAENHCRRALYDAHEFHIAFCLERIGIFQQDYRLVPIPSVLKDYVDLAAKISEARKFIADHLRSEHDSKAAQYEAAAAHADDLEKIVSKFELARDELNKLIAQERRVSRRWIAGTIIALAALGMGTVKVVLDHRRQTSIEVQAGAPAILQAPREVPQH